MTGRESGGCGEAEVGPGLGDHLLWSTVKGFTGDSDKDRTGGGRKWYIQTG